MHSQKQCDPFLNVIKRIVKNRIVPLAHVFSFAWPQHGLLPLNHLPLFSPSLTLSPPSGWWLRVSWAMLLWLMPHPHLTHCDYGPIVLGELSQTLRTSDWVSKRVQGGHRARSTGLATPTSEANSGKNGAPCQYIPFAQSHFIDIIQKWPCSLKEDSFQCPP